MSQRTQPPPRPALTVGRFEVYQRSLPRQRAAEIAYAARAARRHARTAAATPPPRIGSFEVFQKYPRVLRPAPAMPAAPPRLGRWEVYQKRLGSGPRGERQATAKLTEEIVRRIRRSGLSDTVLARLYGVHLSTLWLARHGRTWRHVE